MSTTAINRPAPAAQARARVPVCRQSDAEGRADLAGLVARAADGDAGSWEEITERFSRLVWAIARSHRLNADDSGDVVQNTWLRLLENLRRIEQPEALPGWLATTARREALSLLRRRDRVVRLAVHDQFVNRPDENAPDVDAALLDDERDAELWTCFGRLSERDQQLLWALLAGDRPSYRVVATALDMPVGSIGPTRMRALQRLRAVLDGSDYVFRDSPEP
jgi:RNA polymerase sigma factor (sigma-70 family)